MGHFITEIRRRKVHRAAVIYVVGGYAAIEAADLLSPLLQLPEWAPRLVLGVVLAGFPLAIALSWIFQVTPEGVERTGPAVPDAEPSPVPPAMPSSRPESDDRTAILVAPITSQGLDAGDDFIADGLTDEIITELSQLLSLRVISRASTMRLKGVGDALQDTARDLGVDYVLTGSVRKSGDALRVTLQLIHLDTEESRWSKRYSGSLGDLFGIHDEVASSVAEALSVEGSVLAGGASRATLEDPRAIESYMRARYETWTFSSAGLERAERLLLNALDVVGPNARLYASLGQTYTWRGQLGLDPDGRYRLRAAECADRVFELEPESSQGYRLRGFVHFVAGDLRATRSPLERALDGNPNDPDALMMLGYVSALGGQHARALALFRKTLDVDPLTPINHAMPGFVAVLEGRFADAIPYYRRYYELDPHSPFAVWCLMWSLLFDGAVDEAREAVDELEARHGDELFTPLGRGLLHGVCGERDAARKAITEPLRQAAQTNELFSREVAHVLALAGETEEALDWLEHNVRIGNVNYPFWSQHDPFIVSLRAEPRFADLMAQVQREWRSLNPDLVAGSP